MSEGKDRIRQISWGEVFSFTHIFKSFRMARQPSKLLLALAAITVIFVAGHVLDGIWSMFDNTVRDGDVMAYIATPGPQYNEQLEKWEEGKLEAAARIKASWKNEAHDLRRFANRGLGGTSLQAVFRTKVNDSNTKEDKDLEGGYKPASASDILAKAKGKKSWSQLLDEAADSRDEAIDRVYNLLPASRDAKAKEIDKEEDEDKQAKDYKALDDAFAKGTLAIAQGRLAFEREALQVRGRTIFESFIAHESNCLGEAITAVRKGNFLTGLDEYQGILDGKAIQPVAIAAPRIPAGRAPAEPRGFVFWVLMAGHGLIWLVCRHWLFAIVFLAITLAAWAFFVGAIYRMAAVHAAREEMLSIAQALKFSREKFMHLFLAPLLPLGIIFVAGVLLFVGGAIANLWGIGALVVAILLPVALIIGTVAAFMLIGLIAGMALMYPTIAVEGSETFDALNRSVSYPFERPWRTGLYAMVALLHGTVCYLFIRGMALLTLTITHAFIKTGIFSGGQTLATNADRLDLVWPAPTFANLHPPCSWAAMGPIESASAVVISIWVYLVIGLVAAVLLSYWVCSTTIIYYLLRRKVDATDLDDVYVGEIEDAFVEPETPADETPAAEVPTEAKSADIAESADNAEPPAEDTGEAEGKTPPQQ